MLWAAKQLSCSNELAYCYYYYVTNNFTIQTENINAKTYKFKEPHNYNKLRNEYIENAN